LLPVVDDFALFAIAILVSGRRLRRSAPVFQVSRRLWRKAARRSTVPAIAIASPIRS
jgi:hypothetical protein